MSNPPSSALDTGWVPRETLPPNGERVLIWYNDSFNGWQVDFGRYIAQLDQWRPSGGNGDFRDRITHWRPLPEAP